MLMMEMTWKILIVGRTVEKEVLLLMTNLESKTTKLSRKNEEDFKKQGRSLFVQFILNSIIFRI
jgi:hypothetical protein